MFDDILAGLAESPWALGVLFALVFGDSFLVVIPGEAAVTALAALATAHGRPSLVAVIAVAGIAAFSGDVVCFAVGRRIGLERWAWMRRPRVVGAFDWARARLERSTASIVFTARFIPFARIAVNLTAGASRTPALRYLPISAAAALAWACYQAFIGAIVARLIPGAPALAVVASVVVALLIGAVLDIVMSRIMRPPAPRV